MTHKIKNMTEKSTIQLPRFRPEKIPVIHPLPEYMATGQIAEWYADTKEVLQVPWMGVVTMAFAYYPTFFGELWQGIRPICQSTSFVNGCSELRRLAETRALELQPVRLTAKLADIGYAPKEIEAIRQINEIFSHGNQAYAIIATIARYLLESGEMASELYADTYDERHAPDYQVPFILLEAHHADHPTRELYGQVKKTLKLPFVNTDYRAFARWPSYFALAWLDLQEKVGTDEYEEVCSDLHNRLVAIVQAELPNPKKLSAINLQRAAENDASVEEVLEVCRLFQWLLPGLIANVAYFRHQLAPYEERKK